MIEYVHKTGTPVIDNGQRSAKEPGKPTTSKPEVVDDVFSKSSAVSSDNNSLQKPLANTQENKNVNIKELLGQDQLTHTMGAEDYTAKSDLLRKIKEATERVNASEAALLGVDKLIEYFETSTQFGLEDISTVERNMKDQNMNLEIGLFSLTRVLEQAREALTQLSHLGG